MADRDQVSVDAGSMSACAQIWLPCLGVTIRTSTKYTSRRYKKDGTTLSLHHNTWGRCRQGDEDGISSGHFGGQAAKLRLQVRLQGAGAEENHVCEGKTEAKKRKNQDVIDSSCRGRHPPPPISGSTTGTQLKPSHCLCDPHAGALVPFWTSATILPCPLRCSREVKVGIFLRLGPRRSSFLGGTAVRTDGAMLHGRTEAKKDV